MATRKTNTAASAVGAHTHISDDEVKRAMTERTITETRIGLATSALYEIGMISQALRDHIEKHDDGGQIKSLGRGMLARVLLLSEAVAECIGQGDDWDDRALVTTTTPAKGRAGIAARRSTMGKHNGTSAGAAALVELLRHIHDETEREIGIELERDPQSDNDARDYAAVSKAIEESITANFAQASAAHREGFVRALADLLCMFVHGGTLDPFDNWDPIKTTEASFAARKRSAAV